MLRNSRTQVHANNAAEYGIGTHGQEVAILVIILLARSTHLPLFLEREQSRP
jgi:hypothetical protein